MNFPCIFLFERNAFRTRFLLRENLLAVLGAKGWAERDDGPAKKTKGPTSISRIFLREFKYSPVLHPVHPLHGEVLVTGEGDSRKVRLLLVEGPEN